MTDRLRVALFKWIPYYSRMKSIVRRLAHRECPGIKLEFVDWDSYESDPAEDLDVFEYSAALLGRFREKKLLGTIAKSEIHEIEDVFQFALDGVSNEGTMFGIPKMACTSLLFYRKDDLEVKTAGGLDQLFSIIGEPKLILGLPYPGRSLIANLSGETTSAFWYLQCIANLDQHVRHNHNLPAVADLREDAISNLRLLTSMVVNFGPKQEDRKGSLAVWFARGLGRAYVGWSERLAKMSARHHSKIAIRNLPLSPQSEFNFFFLDTVSISARLSGQMRTSAVRVANICAQAKTMLEYLTPHRRHASPAYVIPVRRSVFFDQRLRQAAPLYNDIEPIVMSNPRAFVLGPDVRNWLARTKYAIHEAITEGQSKEPRSTRAG